MRKCETASALIASPSEPSRKMTQSCKTSWCVFRRITQHFWEKTLRKRAAIDIFTVNEPVTHTVHLSYPKHPKFPLCLWLLWCLVAITLRVSKALPMVSPRWPAVLRLCSEEGGASCVGARGQKLCSPGSWGGSPGPDWGRPPSHRSPPAARLPPPTAPHTASLCCCRPSPPRTHLQGRQDKVQERVAGKATHTFVITHGQVIVVIPQERSITTNTYTLLVTHMYTLGISHTHTHTPNIKHNLRSCFPLLCPNTHTAHTLLTHKQQRNTTLNTHSTAGQERSKKMKNTLSTQIGAF